MRSASYRFNVAKVPKLAIVARAHCPKRPSFVFRCDFAKDARLVCFQPLAVFAHLSALGILCIKENGLGLPLCPAQKHVWCETHPSFREGGRGGATLPDAVV